MLPSLLLIISKTWCRMRCNLSWGRCKSVFYICIRWNKQYLYFWHICIWVGTLHPLLWIISKTWLIVLMFANAEYNAIYIYVGQSKSWNSRCKYDSTLSSMHLGCYICNIHLHLRWHIFVIEYINTNTNESKYAFCHNSKYKKYKYMK